MTLPPVVRVFFALALPPHVVEAMAAVISDMKKITKKHAIRFTKPENLHITLQFVGEVEVVQLAALVSAVQEALQQEARQHVFQFGKLALYPSPFRPRVVVLEVAAAEQMTRVAEAIGKGMVKAGYVLEKRPFRGHMTLGRIKQPRGLDLRGIQHLTVPSFEPLSVNEVVLFRSEPQPEGSQYTPLERLALAP